MFVFLIEVEFSHGENEVVGPGPHFIVNEGLELLVVLFQRGDLCLHPRYSVDQGLLAL